jgi:hypothetical protein
MDGPTPGKRYGHTLTFFKPYLVIFGGFCGTEPVNDTWVLSTLEIPFKWQIVESKNETPEPRLYHSASVCNSGSAKGMIVIFGGRNKKQESLNDSWGLRKHRDGSWEWVKAPYKGNTLPNPRFQVFYMKILIVIK